LRASATSSFQKVSAPLSKGSVEAQPAVRTRGMPHVFPSP
jgi:hypothetical protein